MVVKNFYQNLNYTMLSLDKVVSCNLKNILQLSDKYLMWAGMLRVLKLVYCLVRVKMRSHISNYNVGSNHSVNFTEYWIIFEWGLWHSGKPFLLFIVTRPMTRSCNVSIKWYVKDSFTLFHEKFWISFLACSLVFS